MTKKETEDIKKEEGYKINKSYDRLKIVRDLCPFSICPSLNGFFED